MDELEKKAIRKARMLYKRISPPGYARTLAHCFTTVNDRILFWFNTEDGSTHVVFAEKNNRNV